jgi:small subunit ribosomal protein S20
LKTYVKRVRQAMDSGDVETVQMALSRVNRAFDKAVQRGIVHKNQAARRKSRIAKAAAGIGSAD